MSNSKELTIFANKTCSEGAAIFSNSERSFVTSMYILGHA